MLADSFIVEQSTSPTIVAVKDGGSTYAFQMEAQELKFCNKALFPAWNEKYLRGKELEFHNGQAYIKIGNALVNHRQLLARNGYVFTQSEVNAIVMAAAERQGEWACASKDAVFALLIRDEAKARAMASIAMNESQYGGYPWPWTLNIEGKSYYFKSKEQAYEALKTAINTGHVSVDIGICQVNWKYHARRFQSLWDALDPAKNIAVSNAILTELYERHRNWAKAIACYHNCSDPIRGANYVNRYIKNWNDVTKSKGS